MRVLVACEFSGIVRDAFLKRGHDALSCDLLPTERPGPHIQGDVLGHLNDGFDLMIAHPPCTYLANSGARWLFEHNDRFAKLDAACTFFRCLMDADIERIAIENPMPHKWATQRIGRHFDFAIQPWEYGERKVKRTCFWVKNLPYLMPTDIIDPSFKDKSWESVWREPPGPDQKNNRSRTYQGIADAMAEQWGAQ